MIRFTKGFTFLFVLMLFSCVYNCAWAAAYPTKPIEMIVANSPGGGSDIFARTMVKIITEKKLCPQPIVIINKPGGSSVIGFNYVKQQTGNPYVLGIINGSFYTIPLLGRSPVSYRDFQHISMMLQDPVFLMAPKNAPYKNFKELLAYTTTGGNRVVAGGTSTMSDGALSCYTLKYSANMNIDYVPFNSSGDTLTALLGNHISLGFINPSEAESQLESGNFIALATATGSRLEGHPNVPTLKEHGIALELCQNRGIIAPAGIGTQEIAFLENLFKQVSETKEWQDFLKSHHMVPKYLNASGFSKASAEISSDYERYLKLVPKQ